MNTWLYLWTSSGFIEVFTHTSPNSAKAFIADVQRVSHIKGESENCNQIIHVPRENN
jgi:hypothetical protein